MRGFVDRVTDGIAVILLEGGGRAYVPEAVLPPGTASGHLVEVTIARVDVPTGPDAAEEVAQLIERLRTGGHRHG
ncbi:MAG: hypothetical protein QN187_14385 [Armatimonadota bacterium]|nr:hypothetical protein [Armatimonadota bacterium]MDR7519154.1 hypothetical protein [Armatimonadota bacterium]MDR7551268.1 hypothetical protein [Armatimonadota bacterium]